MAVRMFALVLGVAVLADAALFAQSTTAPAKDAPTSMNATETAPPAKPTTKSTLPAPRPSDATPPPISGQPARPAGATNPTDSKAAVPPR